MKENKSEQQKQFSPHSVFTCSGALDHIKHEVWTSAAPWHLSELTLQRSGTSQWNICIMFTRYLSACSSSSVFQPPRNNILILCSPVHQGTLPTCPPPGTLQYIYFSTLDYKQFVILIFFQFLTDKNTNRNSQKSCYFTEWPQATKGQEVKGQGCMIFNFCGKMALMVKNEPKWVVLIFLGSL